MKRNIIVATIIALAAISIGSRKVDAATSTNEQQANVEIYNNVGTKVKPLSKKLLPPTFQTRATTPPTSIKWMSASASYLSNPFSGSGRRYGGYVFISNHSSDKFKLTFSKGGFGMNVLLQPGDPNSVIESYNLPLSGSPYTSTIHKGFYFLVDNPNSGQTYRVTSIS